MRWTAPDLRGRVAVVTGASRGVGRGIALALGDCGGTVYVTGRSARAHTRARVAQPPPETHSLEFVGRAVAHVLADAKRSELSGTGAQAATLAGRYGFADVDGREIAAFALPDEYRLGASS